MELRPPKRSACIQRTDGWLSRLACRTRSMVLAHRPHSLAFDETPVWTFCASELIDR